MALVGMLSGLAACERPVKPEVDAAQAREAVQTRASATEREGCPAEVIPERASALELFRLAEYCDKRLAWCAEQCFAADAAACYSLARYFRRDMRSVALGDPLLYRACAQGIMSSCTRRAYEMTASFQRSGNQLNVEFTDNVQVNACAARTYEKTCALGDAWGCALHANNLFHGFEVKQDWKKAREAAERACASESEIEACLSAKNLLSRLDVEEKKQGRGRKK
jgi:hypothetical protein